MRRVRALGSVSFAFAAGGIVGTATNILSTAFLGDSLPKMWLLLLASFLALALSAAVLCYLAILLNGLEISLSALPRSLGDDARAEAQAELIRPNSKIVYWILFVGLLLLVVGLSILPIRLLIISK